jgi:hypothetical protein
MSNRVGVHYSSYAAAQGVKCVPLCYEEVTHWACVEFRGEKHHHCQARCETHRKSDEPNTTYQPVK